MVRLGLRAEIGFERRGLLVDVEHLSEVPRVLGDDDQLEGFAVLYDSLHDGEHRDRALLSRLRTDAEHRNRRLRIPHHPAVLLIQDDHRGRGPIAGVLECFAPPNM